MPKKISICTLSPNQKPKSGYNKRIKSKKHKSVQYKFPILFQNYGVFLETLCN